MAGDMSPGRRRGTLDGESCSTEASLDCDGIMDLRLTGWSGSEDEDDEGDGKVDRADGVDCADGVN
jgi:hypothetical protein